MAHSLAEFEQRHQAIAQQVAQLGDLRAGSITSSSGRCGKTVEIPGQRPWAAAIHFPGPTTTSWATYSTSAILPDPSNCRYTNAPSPPFA